MNLHWQFSADGIGLSFDKIAFGCQKNDWDTIDFWKESMRMECIIREWKIEDAASLAEMLNNKNILNNLRDGLPYTYTKSDAEKYITSMLSADKTKTFAFAITVDDKAGNKRCKAGLQLY